MRAPMTAVTAVTTLPLLALAAALAAPPAAAQQETTRSTTQGVPWSTFCREGAEHTRRSSSSNHTVNTREKSWVMSHTSGGCSIDVRARGDVRFTADLTDVERISPRGYLEIRTDDGDTRRRLEIEADADGRLTRRWLVNGSERPFDAEARAFLATALVDLERRTGFAAEQRVPALLERGGTRAVLDEIALMTADHARRLYFVALLNSGRVGAGEMRDVLAQAGREIKSDHELATLLIEAARRGPLDEATRIAYVQATDSIDSDHEHRRALSALLGAGEPSRAVVEEVLRSSRRIGSDHEQAELLRFLAARGLITDAVREPFFAAVTSVESDHEHGRTLSALLAPGKPLGREMVLGLLRSASDGIGSDHQLASLLVEVARIHTLDEAQRQAYVRAAERLRSDHEHRRAMSALVKQEIR